jgi:hypothetical protein
MGASTRRGVPRHDGAILRANTVRPSQRLDRCGPGAALSFATAAIHHGFDSTNGWDADTTFITQGIHQRPPEQPGLSFVRSRTLSSDQLVFSGGLHFTSRVRTLVDVLSSVNVFEGERVLESALRGQDPKHPERWRKADLAEIVRFAREHPRQPGVRMALTLLANRPVDCRPTGSIAETAALQALRIAGFGEPVRQPLVVVEDEHGHPRTHYLDLFLTEHHIDIEVDGSSHLDPNRRAADLQRDRRLAKGMAVLRFSAEEAMFFPERLVQTVRDEIARQGHDRRTRPDDVVGQYELKGSELDWQIVRSRLTAA